MVNNCLLIIMKKELLAIVLLLFCFLFVTSCSKDDEGVSGDFDYPKDELYGTWIATSIIEKGRLIIVEDYPQYKMSITFNKNGTFSGSGYLGNGSGTYKVNGKKIITYVDGEVYIVYNVESLSSNIVNVTFKVGNEKWDIYAYKSSKKTV